LLRGISGSGRVTCSLGSFPADTARVGPVDVLVRPEQIRLLPPQAERAGKGVRALVQGVVFYGPDASVSLRLVTGSGSPQAGGEALTARVLGYQCPRIGDEVTVLVEGDVVVYEARSPA
jgi:iron(III) transport system ATP-binding protein